MAGRPATQTIIEMRPTVWFSVPSYATHLLERSPEGTTAVAVGLAGEPMYASYLQRFRDRGIHCVNHYGLTECPCVAYSTDGTNRLTALRET